MLNNTVTDYERQIAEWEARHRLEREQNAAAKINDTLPEEESDDGFWIWFVILLIMVSVGIAKYVDIADRWSNRGMPKSRRPWLDEKE